MPPLTLFRLLHAKPRTSALRSFTTTPILLAKPLPPRRKILDSEIDEKFLHGSGPGGQKINKTSSAVQLKHHATGLVIKCQETRSRTHNRKLARQILGEKLEEMEKGEQSRTALKKNIRIKKKASADKKKRRKYRALAEGRDGEDGEGEGVEGGAVGEGDSSEVEGEVEKRDVSSGKGG